MNEDSILDLVHKYFPNQHSQFSLSRGDDCAVFSSSYPIAVSTDLFVEDVHFRSSYFSAEDIGHKALAVNLSDLAANGAKPLAFSIGLTLPKKYANPQFLEANLKSMASLAAKYNIFLSGGDLSLGDKLIYCITVWGEQDQAILQRGLAAKDDLVFVIGNLGLARLGLTILEDGSQSHNLENYPLAIKQHLQPDPKCSEALVLAKLVAEQNLRLSLMDLSDGLLRDIPRLIGSKHNLAVDLDFSLDSLEPEIIDYCTENSLDPTLFAIHGGEDYALLGACDSATYVQITKLVATTLIGKVISKPLDNSKTRVYYQAKPLTQAGFDHFRAIPFGIANNIL